MLSQKSLPEFGPVSWDELRRGAPRRRSTWTCERSVIVGPLAFVMRKRTGYGSACAIRVTISVVVSSEVVSLRPLEYPGSLKMAAHP
jgi:hypothetical protein